MKISVITPTYNAEDRIEQTVKSVQEQDYSSIEHIIIDGLSTDRTEKKVLIAAEETNNIYFFSEKDQGLYDAMNKGVEKATGDWCVFLGAGDTLCSKNVLTRIAKEAKNSNASIIYGYVIAEKVGEIYSLIRKIDFQYTIRFLPVCHQAVFAKRELLMKEKFDLQYKIAADQDWLLRNRKKGIKTEFVDIAVANYSYDGVSSSEEGNRRYSIEQDIIHRKYYPIRGGIISWYRSKKSGKRNELY